MPSSTDKSLEMWFRCEILSHEGLLMRYLARMWPDRDDVADIRQEAYARVYEAAQKVRPRAPKNFLFTTARHLSIDRIRRQRTVTFHPCGDSAVFDCLVDEISPERQASAEGDLRLLSRAFDCLPSKSRRVLWLRRIQHYSQRQVAEQLGISEKTVEKHMRVGMRRLAELMGVSDPVGTRRSEPQKSDAPESASALIAELPPGERSGEQHGNCQIKEVG